MIRNRLGRPARSLMVAAAVVCWIPCVPAAAAGALPVQDNTVPGAPTNLRATALSTTAIDLLWDKPSSDGGSPITGYQIQASPNVSTGLDLYRGQHWRPGPTGYTHSGREATHHPVLSRRRDQRRGTGALLDLGRGHHNTGEHGDSG